MVSSPPPRPPPAPVVWLLGSAIDRAYLLLNLVPGVNV